MSRVADRLAIYLPSAYISCQKTNENEKLAALQVATLFGKAFTCTVPLAKRGAGKRQHLIHLHDRMLRRNSELASHSGGGSTEGGGGVEREREREATLLSKSHYRNWSMFGNVIPV